MFKYSSEHIKAVDRQRRTILQYDALYCEVSMLGLDSAVLDEYAFEYIDKLPNTVDSIFYDIMLDGDFSSIYPSDFLPRKQNLGCKIWNDAGFDVFHHLVEQGKKRGKEIFLVSRVSEVDIDEGSGFDLEFKKAHPDWFIKCWYYQGNINLAVKEAREYKVKVIKEVMEKYDFDGIELDFTRHTPFLTPTKQWEERDGVTEYIRMVRKMTLELEGKKGKPVLLSIRVADSIEGNKIDGIDIPTIIQENMVDMINPGDRSINVELEDFKALIGDKNIKLYPAYDLHHQSDGYANPPMEVMRGAFSSWLKQGADGIKLFNFYPCGDETAKKIFDLRGRPFDGRPKNNQCLIYGEVGDAAVMSGRSKTFIAERRGGYPWYDGYMNNNDLKPLPAKLHNCGNAINLEIYAGDDLTHVKTATLTIVLHEFTTDDLLNVELNGKTLIDAATDYNFNDVQITAPEPERTSGGFWPERLEVNPERKLVKFEFKLAVDDIVKGKNIIRISMDTGARYGYCEHNVTVEKCELYIGK